MSEKGSVNASATNTRALLLALTLLDGIDDGIAILVPQLLALVDDVLVACGLLRSFPLVVGGSFLHCVGGSGDFVAVFVPKFFSLLGKGCDFLDIHD